MKGKQQRKPFYQSISQPGKYIDYLYCDFGSPYPTTWRGNWFYFGIWDSTTSAYYAEPMRTKGQTFETF